MSQRRKRLDHLVVERGIADSGSRAKAMIMAGEIRIEGRIADKPGKQYPDTVEIEYVQKVRRYASRGGRKLESALELLPVDVAVESAMDVGASTGGFTDLLLQRGARRVYAIDVGRGVLDYKLREDPRVVVLEGVNARYLTKEQVPELVDLAVMDVSFISLRHLFPAVLPLVREGGVLLPMVKPQFEVGKEDVPRGGVVRDNALQASALRQVASFLYNADVAVENIVPSGVKGPKGNQEYFLLARKRPPHVDDTKLEVLIERAVYV